MPPPFVAIGARSMRVLRNAYTAAIHRRAATVSTLDVLVHVAIFEKWTPPWLLAGSRANLKPLAVEPRLMPGGHSDAELVSGPISEFDPEVQAILREVEWRVRRMAGRLSIIKGSDVAQWDRRPQWTNGARTMLAGTLAAARDNGMPYAGPVHVMLAMLRMPGCDGTRWVFPYEHARVAAEERLGKEPDSPSTPPWRRPGLRYPLGTPAAIRPLPFCFPMASTPSGSARWSHSAVGPRIRYEPPAARAHRERRR
jgi:hypothetical protein